MYARMLKKVFLIIIEIVDISLRQTKLQNQHSKFQFDPEMRATGLSALLLVLPSLNKVNLIN